MKIVRFPEERTLLSTDARVQELEKMPREELYLRLLSLATKAATRNLAVIVMCAEAFDP